LCNETIDALAMGQGRYLICLAKYPAIGLLRNGSATYSFSSERSAVRFAHFLYFHTHPARPLSASAWEDPDQSEWQPHPAAVRWMGE
jgi:hypothetical protein